MKRYLLSTLLITLSVSFSFAQNPLSFDPDDESFAESCTSIMVGKDASSDGSVMTSHTCDANYRTWITIEPRRTFVKGDMDTIRWGLLHTETPWDQRKVTVKGAIPAIEGETFRYLNTAYPCMNEKQLAIGETTTSGKRELMNDSGLFLIEELERIALQHCSDARSAIKLMGSLAETYGYGDGGECLTVADKNEVWQFEIYGAGAGKPGALWVAQRIPDDHVGISANIPRIGEVDFRDGNSFLYGKSLKERSRELGLWDGKSPFVFYKVVSNGKPFSIREFFVLSTLAPSLNLSYDADELPFSVKPEVKVTPEKMMELYRATYDGTEFDQIKDLWTEVTLRRRLDDGSIQTYKDTVRPVSTFMTNNMRALLNSLKPDVTPRKRTIAVIQCSYSHITRLRSWLPDEIGGVCYLALDNPAQSPRFPVWCGTESLPAAFNLCGQWNYSENAAVWGYRETNRIATIDWERTRGVMEPETLHLQDVMMNLTSSAEKDALDLINSGNSEEAKKLLTRQTEDIISLTMARWKELKSKIWMFFVRSM